MVPDSSSLLHADHSQLRSSPMFVDVALESSASALSYAISTSA